MRFIGNKKNYSDTSVEKWQGVEEKICFYKLNFHEAPFVSHTVRRGSGMVLVSGMIFTIEPMINMGSKKIFIDEDNDWTVLTDDGMLSAQWEYTVRVIEMGAEVLAH